MNYNIKATGIVLTPEVRSYIERRLRSLEKFFAVLEDIRVDVELEFLESEEKKYVTNLMLHGGIKGMPLRAEARGVTLHESIDIGIGELSRELTQGKKKQLHIARRSAGRFKEFIRGWRKKF